MKVHIKGITKKKNEIQTITVPDDDSITSVKTLLEYMVAYCVGEYTKRQDNNDLLEVLSGQEIADRAMSGKVAFGKNYGDKTPNLTEAVEHALTSFEDGIVVVFVDGRKAERLEEEITVTAETELTFVKLTMLAGRMW